MRSAELLFGLSLHIAFNCPLLSSTVADCLIYLGVSMLLNFLAIYSIQHNEAAELLFTNKH